jgi:hypothetical protein
MEDGSQKPEITETQQARREFMKTAGKLAVYTPPVLMLLMHPSTKAVAASSGLPTNPESNGGNGDEPKTWYFNADEEEGRNH